MMTGTSELSIPEIVSAYGSDMDRLMWINQQLHRDRKGYILARYALAGANDESTFVDQSRDALVELHSANEEGLLVPPLSTECAASVTAHIEAVRSPRRFGGEMSKFLLSWAIDEGSRYVEQWPEDVPIT